MKQITRTIVEHKLTFAKVEDKQLVPYKEEVHATLPGARYIAKLSKEAGVQVVIMADEAIERKYAMPIDEFMAHAKEISGELEAQPETEYHQHD